MPKTITLKHTLYKFKELSPEAKVKALSYMSDLNTDHDWWQFTYDDAENVGIKISGFDIDRASYCKGDFIDHAIDTANKIIKEHGKTCETYKTAKAYINDRKAINLEYYNGDISESDCDDKQEDLDAEFKKSILEDYRILLSKEYDYLTSEPAIIECIEANDYDFSKDGTFPAY